MKGADSSICVRFSRHLKLLYIQEKKHIDKSMWVNKSQAICVIFDKPEYAAKYIKKLQQMYYLLEETKNNCRIIWTYCKSFKEV